MGGVTGKGFTSGDPRINRKGRPKNFDQLRALAKQIANEVVIDKDGNPIGTLVEVKLREWFASDDARLQMQAMAIAFGKVPDAVEVSGKDGSTLEIVVRRGEGVH